MVEVNLEAKKVVPNYQSLMRPVLECAGQGEVRIGNVVDQLAEQFELSDEERNELLPSGKQDRFTNRVHWTKSYNIGCRDEEVLHLKKIDEDFFE